MPADRFYLDSDLSNATSLWMEGPEFHHLAHVMRLERGEEVELVNGRGVLAVGTLREVGKKGASIEISKWERQDEASFRILLAVPCMRASKLEWVVEKGTELGATSFLFYPAEYSEMKDLTSRQLERLHLLAIAALKQSGRLYLPSIEILKGIDSLFTKEAVFLFGDPSAQVSLDGELSSSVVFISGPERGFSNEERGLLKEKAKGVRLSPYVLRAETAPIAAASILGTRFLEHSP